MTLRRILLAFGLGLALVGVAGWVAFPRALYVRRAQPVDFHHKTHSQKSGISDCDTCHAPGSNGESSSSIACQVALVMLRES